VIQIFRLDGCWVVSEVENIPNQEWGDPDGVLKYPYEFVYPACGGGGALEKWPPFSANREEILIRQSDITVTADVDDNLSALYHTQRKKEKEETE